MNLMVEWIATNALLVWVLLLAMGVLVGDLAWQWNAHQDADSVGHKRFRLRQHAGRRRLAVLLFVLIAFAVSARQSGELPRLDIALARSLHAQLPLPLLRATAMLTHLGDALWIAPAATLLLVLLQVHYSATCWPLTPAARHGWCCASASPSTCAAARPPPQATFPRS